MNFYTKIKNILRVALFGALLLAVSIGLTIWKGWDGKAKKAFADVPSSASSSSGDSSSSSSGDGGGDGGGGDDS